MRIVIDCSVEQASVLRDALIDKKHNLKPALSQNGVLLRNFCEFAGQKLTIAIRLDKEVINITC